MPQSSSMPSSGEGLKISVTLIALRGSCLALLNSDLAQHPSLHCLPRTDLCDLGQEAASVLDLDLVKRHRAKPKVVSLSPSPPLLLCCKDRLVFLSFSSVPVPLQKLSAL